MSDHVRYRLPGSTEIVSAAGTFTALPTGEPPSGFVITDFLHQRVYQLREEPVATEKWHVSAEQPVVISPRDYQIEAQAMLHAFPVMEVEKAVYSRVKQVSFPIEKAAALFEELERTYPQAFVYLVSSKLFGTWVGATPEVLLDAKGNSLKTMALAATHPSAEEYDWTEKEQKEHLYVSSAVEKVLKRNDCALLEKEGPFAVYAGPVQHLKTTFVAQLGETPSWNIAMDLHPTPAVCGTPRMAALDLITSREMHDRFLYTGIIGIHSETRSQLFVNLRCAQLQQEKTYLYVGGGYTIESIPDLEWEETENKARTLLNCMEKL